MAEESERPVQMWNDGLSYRFNERREPRERRFV
jgi:hypothetical protein